jgi:catechol 2,3-dioxygenase-like lactoylglutathione lyase family enzyme
MLKLSQMRLDYAIVFVSDMSRAVSFCRDILGLTLRFETSHCTEIEAGAATLALHLSTAPGDARDPREAPAGRARPGFSVSNLEQFHAAMIARNVPCVQEPREVFGARIATYVDPDGMVIAVSEWHPS